MDAERLRIAVQKSGKLSEGSLDLFRKCGLSISESNRQLLSRIQELPIDILFIRDDDIPYFVSEGVCDLGIVGENVYSESILTSAQSLDLKEVLKLGFSKCRLSIAFPKSVEYNNAKDLNGKKIATSYPKLINTFLQKEKINAEIIKMEGSVEVAPHLKIADCICDIVSTGATLEANGLIERIIVKNSQAILIGRKNHLSEMKIEIIDRLCKRINGVLAAKESKYVMLNAPKSNLTEITNLLPGADSPTVTPLDRDDKVAVHAVCSEPVFWETMEKLKTAGATAILVMPIEKMLG
jgi:ATP phosphoribosyltransferase